MSEIVFIIGLPGSGKSYLCNQYKARGYTIIDDPSVILSKDHIKATCLLNNKVVISDPYLCDPSSLQFLKTNLSRLGNVYFRFVYFENNPEKCLRNIEYRNDGRAVRGLVKHLSKKYFPPPGALEIWQPTE